jgi:hypothetical protein
MNTPKVGDGVTLCSWSDCDPATIVEVSPSGKTIHVQDDRAEVVSGFGFNGTAKYEYAPDYEGQVTVFTLRKNGLWIQKGQPMKGGRRCSVAGRRKYRDPHF